jgi:hypothetical protein
VSYMNVTDILEAIDEEFGQEEVYMWSTYILPNGHFLNPDKSDFSTPAYEHEDFHYWIGVTFGITGFKALDDYCIKMNVTYPYIHLPNNRLTPKQLKAIRKIIDRKDLFEYAFEDIAEITDSVRFNSDISEPLLVSTENDSIVFDLSIHNADDIIKTITRSYYTGKFLFESSNSTMAKHTFEDEYDDEGNLVSVTEFDERGNGVSFEDSSGYWWKREYDSKGNEIYFENSNGFWRKSVFDAQGHQVYYETSNGYWRKSEYDKRGDLVYFEDSDGTVIDQRLKETQTESKQEHTFKDEFDEDGNLFSTSEFDEQGNEVYYEDTRGYWYKQEYDERGNMTYFEDDEGRWFRKEYDSRDNQIYYENDSGFWSKREYDEQGRLVYYEDSMGEFMDNRPDSVQTESTKGNYFKEVYDEQGDLFSISEYDSQDRQISFENAEGQWWKREFDEQGNEIYYESSYGNKTTREYSSEGVTIYREENDYWEKEYLDPQGNGIYYENSNGNWYKREYNSQGIEIYYEDSKGNVLDKRPKEAHTESIKGERKMKPTDYEKFITKQFKRVLDYIDVESLRMELNNAGDMDTYSYYLGALDMTEVLQKLWDLASKADTDTECFLQGAVEILFFLDNEEDLMTLEDFVTPADLEDDLSGEGSPCQHDLHLGVQYALEFVQRLVDYNTSGTDLSIGDYLEGILAVQGQLQRFI